MSDEESREIDGLLARFVEILSPGAVMTKYVVAAEAFEANGERVLITATHNEATAWDSLGLLSFAVAKENAKVVKNMRADE